MVLAQVDDVQQDALVPLRVLHSEVEPKSETCYKTNFVIQSKKQRLMIVLPFVLFVSRLVNVGLGA